MTRPETARELVTRTRRLRAAIQRGDEDRAADHARYLARWSALTKPVTLTTPMEARHDR